MSRLPAPRLLPLALACFTAAGLSAGASFATAEEVLPPRPGERVLDAGILTGFRDTQRVPKIARVSAILGEDQHSQKIAVRHESWVERVKRRLAAHRARAQAASPQPRARRRSREARSLQRRFEREVAQLPSSIRVALHVRDFDHDQTIVDVSGDRLLNPASNQKLLTAIAAVELLGADYPFGTRVLRDDRALYLVDEGDPSLDAAALYDLAQQVRSHTPLDSIETIVVDDSAFSTRVFGPGYDPKGSGPAYMAPSGALSFNFNTVELWVRPGVIGKPARVALWPESPHVSVLNGTRTGRGYESGLQVASDSDGSETKIRVRGRIPARHGAIVLRRRVLDPAAFTGGSFANTLHRLERSSDPDPDPDPDPTELSVIRGRAPTGLTPLASMKSAPLFEVLGSAMKFSNNFTTEQVLRTLAWRATGEPGTWEAGVEIVEEFWAAPDTIGRLTMLNGSGLSREGRVSPRTLVDALALTQRDGSPAQALLVAFSKAGGEGTMRRRLPGVGARLQAKTGTMSGVSALSGIVKSPDGGQVFGFSILINGGAARENRAFQNRLVMLLLRDLERRPRDKFMATG